MVHLPRSTPPSLMADALLMFDNDFMCICSMHCSGCLWHNAWQQAQLSLGRGGLGLHSLLQHSAATYISSVSASEQYSVFMHHLLMNLFNALTPPADAILYEIVSSQCHQRALSSKIEDHQFKLLFDHSPLPDRAQLLSFPNAAAWLSVLPSPGLNLHMDTPEIQVSIKWLWVLDLAQGLNYNFCPSLPLDPLGHHAIYL